MPVPSSINDLSTNPAANSPDGTSEGPGTLDNYQRAHAAFIAQLRDTKAATADSVLLTGNQTVAGVKTFSSTIVGSINGNAATATTAGNVSGTVAIANGGTGQTTAAAAFTALKQAASTTATGVVELATTAEAIAGTDTSRAITPATLFGGLNASGSAPIYACRAWVSFKGTGTVSIYNSGNVSSITDLGAGFYYVNFSVPMPSTVYSALVSATFDLGTPSANIWAKTMAKEAVRCQILINNNSGVAIDAEVIDVAFFN